MNTTPLKPHQRQGRFQSFSQIGKMSLEFDGHDDTALMSVTSKCQFLLYKYWWDQNNQS